MGLSLFGRALLFLLLVVSSSRSDAQEPPAGGKATVVWISMDGFAADYLGRVPTPFFDRLMKEGAFSRKFHPVFPSLTFPSHCSQATGVEAGQHGIVANAFYDTETKKIYRFPGDSELLLAEPIWLAAKRQGIRDLVFDWPLSQKELTPVRADYFNEKFDPALHDEQRLARILETWRLDAEAGGEPLRLLMGYVEGTDPAGHRFGPGASEVGEELKKLDALLAGFFEKALAQWKVQADPADRILFLFSTDHGMSAVEKSVSLEKVLDLAHGQTEVTLVGSGNTANIYLDKIPAGAERQAQVEKLMTALRAFPFIQAWRQAELPETWGYGNAKRTGDIVAVLPKGYTFSSGPVAVSEGGVKGMHGYPVEQNADMLGVTFLWSSTPLGGKDLGEVKWDQYVPTVARWLGIQAPPAAKGRALELGVK